MSAKMFGYTSVDGEVGDVAMTPITFIGEILEAGVYGDGSYGGGSYGN
jgi:hypothetical protein